MILILSIQVPLQPNAYDCGIYVLHFIEMFLQQPEKIMSILTVSFYIYIYLFVKEFPEVDNNGNNIDGLF